VGKFSAPLLPGFLSWKLPCMIWVLRVKQMGLRKEFACFSILLLLLLLLQTSTSSSAANGSARYGAFKTGSPSKLADDIKSNGHFGGGDHHKDEDGDHDHDHAVFGDEKRKVYTGPNPLHNR
jgi:hypothetical protein